MYEKRPVKETLKETDSKYTRWLYPHHIQPRRDLLSMTLFALACSSKDTYTCSSKETHIREKRPVKETHKETYSHWFCLPPHVLSKDTYTCSSKETHIHEKRLVIFLERDLLSTTLFSHTIDQKRRRKRRISTCMYVCTYIYRFICILSQPLLSAHMFLKNMFFTDLMGDWQCVSVCTSVCGCVYIHIYIYIHMCIYMYVTGWRRPIGYLIS